MQWSAAKRYEAASMEHDVVVDITSDSDLVTARAEARALAARLGFSRTDATLVATAVSEIARNIVVHVGCGRIAMRLVREDRRHGLVAIATDEGPGIHDVEAALARGNAARVASGSGSRGRAGSWMSSRLRVGPSGARLSR